MNKNLELIRQKCIEANPEKKEAECHFCKSTNDPSKHVRLADVLLAIETKLEVNGPIFDRTGEYGIEYVVNRWNLRKDDLNEQSEETINFLAELLK